MDHAITYAIELVNDAINDGAQLHNRATSIMEKIYLRLI